MSHFTESLEYRWPRLDPDLVVKALYKRGLSGCVSTLNVFYINQTSPVLRAKFVKSLGNQADITFLEVYDM